MRKLALVIATAVSALIATPLVGTTGALAQRVGVEVGPGGVYVGERDRHCRTVRITEWRHGVKVTRTERRCGGWRD